MIEHHIFSTTVRLFIIVLFKLLYFGTIHETINRIITLIQTISTRFCYEFFLDLRRGCILLQSILNNNNNIKNIHL